MDAHEHDRIERLEARIEALEARLRAFEGPAAPRPVPPRPVPPPLPQTQPGTAPPPLPKSAAQPKPPKPKHNLEQFIGLTILGRAGAAAVVIAAAYFGKLGWDHIGPAGRVACLYGLAALMLAAGFTLRQRVAELYVAILFGGAVAVSYVAGLVAKIGYDLIGGGTAMTLLVASTVLGQWLGRMLRLEPMATIALAGGFAAPVLVGDPSATPTALLIYMLVLHGWAAWTEHRWQWYWARAIAVLGTASILTAWFANSPMPTPLSVVVHIEAALLGLIAPELLRAFLAEVPRPRWVLAMVGLWLVQLGLVGYSLAYDEVAGYGICAGGGWLAIAVLLARRTVAASNAANLAGLGGTLLAFGAVLVWNIEGDTAQTAIDQPWQRLGSLLAASAVVLALRRVVGAADLAIAVAAVLALPIVLEQPTSPACELGAAAMLMPATLVWLGRSRTGMAIGLVVGTLITVWAPSLAPSFGESDGRWALVAFAATGVWLANGAWASARRDQVTLHTTTAILLAIVSLTWILTAVRPGLRFDDLDAFVNWRFAAALTLLAAIALARRFAPKRPWQGDLPLIAAAALAVAYLAGLIELLDAVHDWQRLWRGAVVSLYSTAFAATLLAAGFWRQNAALRWTGLVGFLLVVAKVALVDLAELDTPLRVLVTGVLGLVLLVGAYGYARRQRPAQPAEPEPPAA